MEEKCGGGKIGPEARQFFDMMTQKRGSDVARKGYIEGLGKVCYALAISGYEPEKCERAKNTAR